MSTADIDGTRAEAPPYFDFACCTMDKVYDIRALIEAARSRLNGYEHGDSADELVDLDRVLRMVTGELSTLVMLLDSKSHAYTLKNPSSSVGAG